MHVSGSGPLGVLLMIAPLAAIPVFAILGVPHFAPVAASGTDDDDFAVLGEPDSPAFARRFGATSLRAPVRQTICMRPSMRQEIFQQPRRCSGRQRPGTSTGIRNAVRRFRLPAQVVHEDWGAGCPPPKRSTSGKSAPTMPIGHCRPNRMNRSLREVEPITDGFEGLEAAADTADDGQVSAEGFNPDLLKPGRSKCGPIEEGISFGSRCSAGASR